MKITYTFLLHEFTVDIKLLLKLHTMHSVWVHISAKQNINSQPTFYAWPINPHSPPPRACTDINKPSYKPSRTNFYTSGLLTCILSGIIWFLCLTGLAITSSTCRGLGASVSNGDLGLGSAFILAHESAHA